MLLLHGSSLAVDAWLTWFRLFDALPGHRVIAYDQPGFGRSEVPADRRYLDRLERSRHAEALLELLDLTDVTLVGHSEGGFLATRLAITCADRVRRLIVVTSGATAPRLGDGSDEAWMAASAATYDYARHGRDADAFLAGEPYLRRRHDPAFAALLRANFEEASLSGNRECFLRLGRRRAGFDGYTALQERWLFPFLGNLRVPTLLVWSGEDPTVPPARGLALAALFPNCEFHLFPRSGHWPMHEQPEAFARLVRAFLQA